VICDAPAPSETAQYLRLCEKQVRRLIWRGELAAFRFGTALRIKKVDIAVYSGGGFSKISQSHYGCSTARNKGTCNNLLTGYSRGSSFLTSSGGITR
jgi:excisionase family DNA binding protein